MELSWLWLLAEKGSAAMSQDGLQQMAKLVNTFVNRSDTMAFRAPVDPKAMNIPDYFQIVKNPMDLGTVSAWARRTSGLLCYNINSATLRIYKPINVTNTSPNI